MIWHELGNLIAVGAVSLILCSSGCTKPDPAPTASPRDSASQQSKMRRLLPSDVRDKVETLEADVAENQQRALDVLNGEPLEPHRANPGK